MYISCLSIAQYHSIIKYSVANYYYSIVWPYNSCISFSWWIPELFLVWAINLPWKNTKVVLCICVFFSLEETLRCEIIWLWGRYIFVLWETARTSSKMVVLFYTWTKSIWEFWLFCILASIWFCPFWCVCMSFLWSILTLSIFSCAY